jgi:hypothetical protein
MTPLPRARKQELAHEARFLRQWQAWRAEQRAAALAGPYGELLQQLLGILRTATLQDGAGDLIAFVESQDWGADADFRHLALSEIDTAIIALRERAGLAVFDDPLGPAVSGFLILREVLTPAAGLQPEDGAIT